jgi:transposase
MSKVGLKAIRVEASIADLMKKHGVHHVLIHSWRHEAIEGMSGPFSRAMADTLRGAAVNHASADLQKFRRSLSPSAGLVGH